MKKTSWQICLGLLALTTALSACGKKEAEDGESEATEETAATAIVRVAELSKGTMAETISALGTVVPQPIDVTAISVPFECRVVCLLVASGQPVQKEDLLVEVEPSPDARLQLAEARTEKEVADKDLEDVEKLFAAKLATNSERQHARKSAQDAATRLESLERQGAAATTRLTAPTAGVVGDVAIHSGQTLAPSEPILTVLPENNREVRLGVEPEEATRLAAGQSVHLTGITLQSNPVVGTVRLITRSVNPQTRLVDVYASVAPGAELLLGSYMRGEINLASTEALLAPRAAVLEDEQGRYLYIIRDGHAVRQNVTTGLENEKQIQILGSTLQPGDPVVASGNYELQDGMGVRPAADE